MHFGSTSSGKTLWPGKPQRQSISGASKRSPVTRAIVSGYIANKIQNAGGQKAARKTRNLARLRKKYNPMPAAKTAHALQRYKERGSSSSPIYKSWEGEKRAIVVTYVPIQRKNYSDAKKSRQTIQLEVDRMSQLSTKSDLPKSRLSSRDSYLFKLSSQAAKKEEYRRRSTQKRKAYAKWTPLSINSTQRHLGIFVSAAAGRNVDINRDTSQLGPRDRRRRKVLDSSQLRNRRIVK